MKYWLLTQSIFERNKSAATTIAHLQLQALQAWLPDDLLNIPCPYEWESWDEMSLPFSF
jgi:hypothetical protein